MEGTVATGLSSVSVELSPADAAAFTARYRDMARSSADIEPPDQWKRSAAQLWLDQDEGVVVTVVGGLCGRLAKDDAAVYRPVIAQIAEDGTTVYAPATWRFVSGNELELQVLGDQFLPRWPPPGHTDGRERDRGPLWSAVIATLALAALATTYEFTRGVVRDLAGVAFVLCALALAAILLVGGFLAIAVTPARTSTMRPNREYGSARGDTLEVCLRRLLGRE